ncbi:STAS domain-containing protein [Dactylosporangium matsuzakiense]|uniref:STAS domain-containing protein n=1 Tax=Dactylosporangium matsuzakiense TaxID=53360 RepID=UPI0021C35C2F|nr:STAS domain-containing protein [Dactylosporangium matsuzakiense]UWZ42372.1 STAS domain-containing protein [Dactylosporangium matsuzakiense]
MSVNLEVDVHTGPAGTATVVARGDLDYNTAPAFRAAVTAALADRPTTLCLDLAALTFMDSSGIVALLAAHSAAAALGCALVLDGVTPWLRTRFAITGLDKVLSLDDPPPALA